MDPAPRRGAHSSRWQRLCRSMSWFKSQTKRLFDTLQNATDPTFARNMQFEESEECQDERGDMGGTSMSAQAMSSQALPMNRNPTRQWSCFKRLLSVLTTRSSSRLKAEANSLVKPTGELLPGPKSEPLLDEYVEEDQFLGIKLSS